MLVTDRIDPQSDEIDVGAEFFSLPGIGEVTIGTELFEDFVGTNGLILSSDIIPGVGTMNSFDDGLIHFIPSGLDTDTITATLSSYSFQTSPVPIPAAIWLFGTALIGLVGFSKRRKAA